MIKIQVILCQEGAKAPGQKILSFMKKVRWRWKFGWRALNNETLDMREEETLEPEDRGSRLED